MFKYLQIMRKLFSNPLSFPLLLLDRAPFCRRKGNISHKNGYNLSINFIYYWIALWMVGENGVPEYLQATRRHQATVKTLNRIGGVMISVLASSAVDRGLETRSGQTKDY